MDSSRQTAANRSGRTNSPAIRAAVVGAGALAAASLCVRFLARRAERENPPRGRFLEVDGVRLHYVERGQGQPLVLIHGNVFDLEDFEHSGILEQATRRYRVIAIDRPGFGYSERPEGESWSAERQAALLRRALDRLGVERPLLLGHSWGTLVASAMALAEPGYVKGLVLLAGYYYPTARLDVPVAATAALPVIGTLLRHTVSPLTGRLLWNRMAAAIFSPAEPPPRFADYPAWLALRPSQLRAAASDAASMVPGAARLRGSYAGLTMPVAILAGDGDRIVDPEAHSRRLHGELPHSELHLLPGVGHMVHYLAPEAVLAAVDHVAAAGITPAGKSTPPARRTLPEPPSVH